ncbi:MAG: transposase, partial [Patescibacteria group bacterium]|nr:transposase [Patescibacteria group bacterium]
GEEVMEKQVSNFFLTDEINTVYAGMMIALPPENWTVFQSMSPKALAAQLLRWARTADLANYPKHPRGPKKLKKKRANAQFQHVATAKLLEEDKQRKSKRRKRRKPRTAATSGP